MDTNPVQQAVSLAGGISALAKELSVAPPTVAQWVRGIRQVPAERCPQIERATKGAVRCEDLRPDIEWSVLRCPATGIHPAMSSPEPKAA